MNKMKFKSLKQLSIITACLLPVSACQTIAQATDNSSSWSKKQLAEDNHDNSIILITATIKNYFNGRRNADLTLLEKAFSTKARLATIGADDNVKIISLDDYLSVVKNKGKVTVTTELEYLKVKNHLAFAEVTFHYANKNYTDYLILLKENNHWKIVSKTFIAN